jgi:hypothetical protein
MNSLSNQMIVTDIELKANQHVLTISFDTEYASYLIAVPTCDEKGHLDKTAFQQYKA